MIESMAIYCFVVSMILIFANPFWNHVIAHAHSGKVSHAHRLVHRRCAGAQLPHPGVVAEAFSLQAHPQRHRRAGERIAAELADAEAKKAEAQKDRDDFQHKNEEFDQQRAALLKKATDEAKAERQRLLDEARRRPMPCVPNDRKRFKSRQQPESGHHPLDPAGSLCHRAKGADGSRHGESGRTHGRRVHRAACAR